MLRLACILLFLSGCTNPFESRNEPQLRDAEARWRTRNISAYTFEMRTICFCPPEINEWAVVEVEQEQIVSARTLSGVTLTGIARTSRKSVAQLFDAAIPPYGEWVGRVDLKFDSELGYPVRISLEGKPNILDAGVVYEARNLRPRVLIGALH